MTKKAPSEILTVMVALNETSAANPDFTAFYPFGFYFVLFYINEQIKHQY